MPTSYTWTLEAETPETPGAVTPPTFSAAAYARQLKQLLPRGPLWNLFTDSWISAVLLAIGDELARVDGRARDLFTESDPSTATETLGDWERVLGLPDHCIEEIPGTDAERRIAITQKLVARGGQTAAYFILLAAACGYTATVDDTYGASILRAGFLTGAACYGTEWAHVWKMTLEAPAGDALSHDELECIIRRVAPAQTVVIFEYL